MNASDLPESYRRCIDRKPALKPAPMTKAAFGRELKMWKDTADRLAHPAPGADSITFWVGGEPQPGGSKSSFVPTNKAGEPYRGPGGRIIVNTVDANKHVKDWKKTVARAARQHFTRAPHEGPVEWRFDFIVTRPQYHFGTGRNAECLKDSAPPFPTGKPDCVKLCRGTEDALTSVCWIDDSQVVRCSASKSYGAIPGVQITVWAATVIEKGNVTPSQMELPEPPQTRSNPPEDDLPLPL